MKKNLARNINKEEIAVVGGKGVYFLNGLVRDGLTEVSLETNMKNVRE